MSISIESASITDGGLGAKRAVNEDSLLVMEKQGAYVVADGVGGAQAGDVASQCVVAVIRQELSYQKYADLEPANLANILIHRCNSEVYKLARNRNATMASTIAMLLVQHDSMAIAHVGDSRIYLYRDNDLLQLTTDHSKLQYLLDHLPPNTIDEENFAEGNVITKALGAAPVVEPDIRRVHLRNRDIFVLCTDGIHNYNNEAELSSNLRVNAGNLDKVCLKLKDNCYAKGARDHLSAIVLKVRFDYSDMDKTVMMSPDLEKTVLMVPADDKTTKMNPPN